MFAFSQMNLLSGSFLKLCLMFHIICLVIGTIMPFVHREVRATLETKGASESRNVLSLICHVCLSSQLSFVARLTENNGLQVIQLSL